MKITEIEIFDIHCPKRPPWNPVFVRIHTDEGITGWGEITNYPGSVGNRAIQRYAAEIKEFLVGSDPTQI